MNNDRVTYFAETDYRNQRTPFGIKSSDRTRHMYVIGKTGMGKSTMLENMAIQDIRNGEGIAFVDPHGATADKLLSYVPKERMDDVIYFAPFDLNHPVAFNIMEDVGYDKRHLVANGLMSAFKKIWVDAWSARMEYILNNCILALLEYPDSTLLSVNKMLVDKKYRKKVVENITDPAVKSFWVDEFAKYTDRYAQEATPAIQNKVGQFTANPLIRNIVGQPESSFDIRKAMDEKKILIMNLSKGQMGEQNADLLGSMIVTKIYLAAMSRADLPDEALAQLPNFYFYVDEFQSFANESFADILSEARKYKLNLTIAHQYVEQMPDEVRAAVFGNVGTMVTFRIGSYDAEIFEKEFLPRFEAQDIVSLGFAQIYLKLMIDGIGSQPFSAVTLPPIEKPELSFHDEIIDLSREHYAFPRAEVEKQISAWHDTNGGDDGDKKKDEGKYGQGRQNQRGGNNGQGGGRRETNGRNGQGQNTLNERRNNGHDRDRGNGGGRALPPFERSGAGGRGGERHKTDERREEHISLKDLEKNGDTRGKQKEENNTLKSALTEAIAKHETKQKEEQVKEKPSENGKEGGSTKKHEVSTSRANDVERKDKPKQSDESDAFSAELFGAPQTEKPQPPEETQKEASTADLRRILQMPDDERGTDMRD